MIGSQNEPTTQKRKILIYENTYTLTEEFFKKWIAIAQQSVERNNRFTVALSGGRSPMEFYCKLSSLNDFALWKRTHIFLGDERFVPFEHDSSNFKMIKENLLDYINIPQENIHPITTNHKNVELAAEQYKHELIQFFEFKDSNAPCFDLILLGIGTDGHTASLFPDDGNINNPDQLVLPVSLPHLKEDRVSLTLPVINNARNVYMLVLGVNKAEIIKNIIEKNNTLPASRVDPAKGQMVYLVDREAAQKLPYHSSYTHEGLAILYEPNN